MKFKLLLKILFLSFILNSGFWLLASAVFADVSIYPNAGTTSATFLKLGIGSRAIGMGEAFSALSDDITALYWNPAGLVQLKKSEIQVTHNESFEGIKHEFLGYAVPLSKGTLAIAAYGVTIPKDLERRSGLYEDDPFEPYTVSQGNFGAYDMALHISYAKQINANLSGGVSLKLIQQNIDDISAYGAAADIGALYRVPDSRLSLAFVLENMGPKIKFRDEGYYPPFTVRLGSAWRWNNMITQTLDVSKSIDNFPFIMTGCEFTPIEFLAVRVGYKYRIEGQELTDDMAGLSAGLGVNLLVSNMNFRLDYAFTPYGVLGNSQRFSITSFFGGKNTGDSNITRVDKKIKVKTIPVPKPVIIKEEPVKLALPNYTICPAQTSTKLRMSNGKMSIYYISATCDKRTVFAFDGIFRGLSPSKLSIDIIEKEGKDNVIKFIDFKNNLSIPITQVTLKIRIPKSWGEVDIENPDGYIINKNIIYEGVDSTDYSLKLETLEPITIRKK
jgi:hypothetical protein